MAKTERNRFNVHDDLVLLNEIVRLNPYDDKGRWNTVQLNVSRDTGKMLTVRAVRERTEYLLKLFSRNDISKLRRSGTMHQYEEKMKLLRDILDITQGFSPSNRVIDTPTIKDEPDTNPLEDIEIVPLPAHNENETSTAYSDESLLSSSPPQHDLIRCLRRNRAAKIALQRRRYTLEERKLRLEEERLRFEVRKFETETKEREARLQMEMEQGRCNMEILKQQQSVINYFINKKRHLEIK